MSSVRHLIVIDFGGRSVATASCERIKGAVASLGDIVVYCGETVMVRTAHVGEFISAFYEDGFDEKLEITCEES